MAIVKIQQVRSLNQAVNYCIQDSKTDESLITSNDCFIETIEGDFQSQTNRYNQVRNANKKIKSQMIIQSYSEEENLTPEQVHELGIELADMYLNGNHQYVVITHKETDHIHNHIIFNCVGNDLKMYNSKRKHTVYDLRDCNDEISRKHGLDVLEETSSKGMTFREYVARSKKVSFKSELEKILDETISISTSYDDFLTRMSDKGYTPKKGKYLAFRNPKSDKFMRSKTLGIDYAESSIIFRIEHKDYIPYKQKIIQSAWIDTRQEKFRNSIGLQKWAIKQNINYLSAISTKMYREKKTLSQLSLTNNQEINYAESFEKKLQKIDNKIFHLTRMSNCFDVYRNSHSMIIDYKNSPDKEKFKKDHYAEFKAYDLAKKNINSLKKVDDIHTENELNSRIKSLKKERDELYASLNLNRTLIEKKER